MKRIDQFIENPKKGLFLISWPIMIGFLVQTLYNIIDTVFVGRISADAIAALTFSFPLFFIIMALTGGIGAGVNSRISRYLGEKKIKAAENTAVHGLILSFVVGTTMIVLGLIFLKPLFILLGAEGNVLKLALDYMNIVMVGFFFVFGLFLFHSIFSAQGDTKTATIGQVAALILNIILDPILIYVLGWGVKGAAIATAVSFFFGFLLMGYFIRTRSELHLNKESFEFSWKIVREILFVGLPASMMMLIMSFSLIFINKIMVTFGTEYVAVFGMIFRFESLVMLPMVALSLGLLTLVGMFKGAGQSAKIKEITVYGAKIALASAFITGAILFFFPQYLFRIFTDDPALIMLITNYVQISVFALPFAGISIIASRVLQGMGKGLPTMIINLVRMVLVGIPLAYLFVFIFGYGYLSVALAMVIGSFAAAMVGYFWLRIKFKRLLE